MTDRLAGQVAVVTGGAQGIGQAIALRLQAEGARVVVADIFAADCSAARETVESGMEYRRMDVTAADEVRSCMASVFESCGRLTILVNNAGITFDRGLEEMTEAEWDRMMNINLKGVFLCAKYAVGYMRRSGGGSIINIGSLEGLACNPLHTAYAASKGGVHALTRAIAVDHGCDHIRCNVICPGWINTAFNDAYFDALRNREAGIAAITALHPVGRLGTPEDVAGTAVWLADPEAGFVTGQQIVVDGGRLCRPSLPDFAAMEKKDALS
jgi:meso-butanediol dehydrogenase/(S,S)-butanediol dehydrogenase/diacetyl reductase